MESNFLLHFIEFRQRLLFILFGFFLAFIVLFHFANDLYTYLSHPLNIYLPVGTHLIATDIMSPFIVPLKLTAIIAFFISLPNSIYHIWKFIAPGLYRTERSLLLVTMGVSVCLFVIGIMFCYFIVLPILFKFIGHIKAPNILMLTDISKYLDLVLNLFFMFGLVFETPIIVCLCVYFNLIKRSTLVSYRRYIVVISFIIAAIIAPPDVLSQTLLAIPLYLLYEIGLYLSKFISQNRNNT